MESKECSHGIKWENPCLECELVSHKQTILFFKNKVIHAEKRVLEIEYELAKKNTLQA